MDIYVTEIKFEDEALKCYAEEDTQGLKAAARMIVDSDNMAFIYMLDDGEEFRRVHFVKETWSMLKAHHGAEVILNTDVILTDFWDELDYLIENIEDNNNYGEAFESAVKEEFIQ
ncbi:hypothetical protein [Salinicoccus bachuensis]|uniref:Uncharacterized protein n=1 Tax=Salinicoccus bachuensis TaxID=3136731 RepID=A0ABZ3CLA3_9STAP